MKDIQDIQGIVSTAFIAVEEGDNKVYVTHDAGQFRFTAVSHAEAAPHILITETHATLASAIEAIAQFLKDEYLA